MVKREYLERDDRFYINPSELDWLFSHLIINSYSFEKIKVGKLKRFVGGKIVILSNTINYRFLAYPEDAEMTSQYELYCNNNENLSDNPNRSKDIFLNLRDKLLSEEYNPHKSVIIINQYNIVEDGLHRSCILLKKYGSEHMIDVLRIRRKNSKKLYYLNPIFEIKQFLFR